MTDVQGVTIAIASTEVCSRSLKAFGGLGMFSCHLLYVYMYVFEMLYFYLILSIPFPARVGESTSPPGFCDCNF